MKVNPPARRTQAERTAALLVARGFEAATRNDYDGIARIVRGRRAGA